MSGESKIYYERNLPHWLPEGKHLFLTWRLHGSLPVVVLNAMRENRELAAGREFVRFDQYLDGAGFGPIWLKEPGVAKLVTNNIEGVVRAGWCAVHAYVIMPNHVHLLLEPKIELKEITKAIKGRSARECNMLLRRTGRPFWQEESHDHWIRNAQSFEKIRRYIERNPVSAGLVKNPEDGEWSSAHK
jgi:REP element-mobilizing transposase RayT